jgi:flagellin-like protein
MKGISAMLASVLLIAFTLAIAVLVLNFFTGTITDSTKSVSNKTSSTIECASAAIAIQDVYITGSAYSQTVKVIVKNSGLANNLIIQDAQIINVSGSNFSTAPPTGTFNKGNLLTLTFSGVSLGACPTSFSKAIVATSCAGIADTFDGTPKCL